MTASQSYLKLILEHPSMPKSTHLPNYCTVIEEKNYDTEDEYDIEDFEDNIENNIDDDDINSNFRTSYMPPDVSPLGIYLDNVKKQFKKQPQLRQQKYYYPKNPIKNLGSKPTPFNFYTDVLVCKSDLKSNKNM